MVGEWKRRREANGGRRCLELDRALEHLKFDAGVAAGCSRPGDVGSRPPRSYLTDPGHRGRVADGKEHRSQSSESPSSDLDEFTQEEA